MCWPVRIHGDAERRCRASRAERRLSPNQGLSQISIAVDCRVAETVDLTRLVTGRIPKLFGR